MTHSRRFALASLAAALLFFSAGAAWAHRPAPSPRPVRQVTPYSLEVRSGAGQQLPTFHHRGKTYVRGQLGQRYEIVVTNHTAQRIEAVVSVDGLDAIDGKRGSLKKRGYLIAPYGTLIIDGFRVSKRDVAAFRFSDVPHSYAASKGQPRNIGVIGVAIFTEKRRRILSMPPHRPHHHRGHPHRKSKRYHAPQGGAAESKPRAGHAPKSPPAVEPRRRSSRRHRPAPARDLGTEFGERRHSPVVERAFTRATPRHPAAQLQLRYNDAAGLRRLGIRLRPPRHHRDHLRQTATPFAESTSRFARPPRGW